VDLNAEYEGHPDDGMTHRLWNPTQSPENSLFDHGKIHGEAD